MYFLDLVFLSCHLEISIYQTSYLKNLKKSFNVFSLRVLQIAFSEDTMLVCNAYNLPSTQKIGL